MARVAGAVLLACAALAAPATPAAPLADRLPAGASLVAEADFAAMRAAKVVDRAAWDAAGGPDVLERAGVSFRRDVDRVALAVLPSAAEGKDSDVVALMAGRFDKPAVQKALLLRGAKAVKLGDVPAWRMSGGSSIDLHPSLPSIDMDANEVFVSFLGDLLVLGTERGTRAAHGPKEGLPSPALAAARASVPGAANAWLAVDASGVRGTATGPLQVAQGLKSLTAWGVFGDALELRALARTSDAAQATQLASMVRMLAGIAAATPEGRVLASLDVKPSGDSVQAALHLTAEQIRELGEAAEPPPSAPVTPPPPKGTSS